MTMDRKSARPVRWLLTSVILICSAGASAQQPAALPRFQVELVVFENLAQPPTGEAPPIEWPEPLPGSELPGTSTEAGSSDPIFFSLSSALDMENIAASLQRRNEYRVLLHEAWIQDGFAGEAARAVDVGIVEQLPPVSGSSRRNRSSSGEPLAGTVTLFRGRYLHLDLDLSLGHGAGRQLRERRRVRIGERHYFDAPGIGVIATVTRIELADRAEAPLAGD